MLEMSKRHVSKMSMCMCDMFGVSGTYRPFPEEDVFYTEREKCENAERGFGVWSFVFIRKKKEVHSECFRKKRAGMEGI